MIGVQKRIFNKNDFFIFGILCGLELIVAWLLTATHVHGIGTPFLFGFAKRWIVILIFPVIGSLLFLLLGFYAAKNGERIEHFLFSRSKTAKALFTGFSIAAILWAFVSFLAPLIWFLNYRDYVRWMTPVSVTTGLIFLQFWILFWKRTGKPRIIGALLHLFASTPFLVVFLFSIISFVLIGLTRFGIVSNQDLWKGPGIPLSSIQALFVFVGLTITIATQGFSSWFDKLENSKAFSIVVPILLFIAAIYAWGSVPFQGDALAVKPAYPDFQPYPRKDAAYYDIGGLSILQGTGIYFHGYTDKPLYMILLSILHLFTGNDYVWLQWAHIALLAAIPVFAYFLGKHFYNPIFGILISIFLILQQRNAVELSRRVASVNVKIFATEPVTLLGVIFLAYIFFKWYQSRDWKLALLLGGGIGAISLIRLNPIFFFPAVGLMLFLFMRKQRRLWITSLLLFIGGFSLVFTPWIVTGTTPDGVPWFYAKIESVIKSRIQGQIKQEESRINPAQSEAANIIEVEPEWADISVSMNAQDENIANRLGFEDMGLRHNIINSDGNANPKPGFFSVAAQHFTHNVITSFLSLPDSNLLEGIIPLSLREYWHDDNSWNGDFPLDQLKFVVINLVLVALGIARSWKRHRWGGLIPLILFFVYDISLSAAMTSGGRYIVPINWIFYFYYGLGLITLIEAVLIGIRKQQEIETPRFMPQDPGKFRWKPLLPILAGLVLTASLIPIANLIYPLIVKPDNSQNAAITLSAQGVDTKAELTYLSGTAIYPVYDPGSKFIYFSILYLDRAENHKISAAGFLRSGVWLKSGEEIIVGLNSLNEAAELYFYRNGKMVKY